MKIEFTKMQALGNDFMVINGIKQKFIPDAKIIQRWANRHTGIGFDQLLLVEKATNPKADFSYRIFNADGGEVAQCGNGARCLAKFLHDENLTQKNTIMVETRAGSLELQIKDNGNVSVNMGIPALVSETFISLENHQFIELDIGNPHAVLLVDDVENAPVKELGPYLSHHPHFPNQANIGFMQIIDKNHIRLRVYERGAGETQACGSGACAAVIAGVTLKKLDANVHVTLPGGALTISWAGVGKPVFLTGPAVSVYMGIIA